MVVNLAVSEHPDRVIVCAHGIRGGHLDELVRYRWPPRRRPGVAHWGIPIPGPSGEVRQTQLAGNRPGTNSIFTADPGLPRMHHEIICVTQHCRCRAYRSDVARLQTLFRAISDNSVLLMRSPCPSLIPKSRSRLNRCIWRVTRPSAHSGYMSSCGYSTSTFRTSDALAAAQTSTWSERELHPDQPW